VNGVIKFFNRAKGYGFIRRGKDEPDVFFHESVLVDAKQADTGQEVEYELHPSFPEPRALSVRLLGKRAYVPITQRKEKVAYGD
jgi:cold shock CspA family protein